MKRLLSLVLVLLLFGMPTLIGFLVPVPRQPVWRAAIFTNEYNPEFLGFADEGKTLLVRDGWKLQGLDVETGANRFVLDPFRPPGVGDVCKPTVSQRHLCQWISGKVGYDFIAIVETATAKEVLRVKNLAGLNATAALAGNYFLYGIEPPRKGRPTKFLLRQMDTGKETEYLITHPTLGEVQSISPDGSLVLFGSTRNTNCIIDIASDKVVWEADTARNFHLSEDGKRYYLQTVSGDNSLIQKHDLTPEGFKLSSEFVKQNRLTDPDPREEIITNEMLVTWGLKRTHPWLEWIQQWFPISEVDIRFIDLRLGKEISRFNMRANTIHCEITPDRRHVLVSEAGAVSYWNMEEPFRFRHTILGALVGVILVALYFWFLSRRTVSPPV